ncbi:unnamed protein product, partial [Mesorhabditis belari]|uniref:Uncharacterized protein n=1 Tax=Mesorhabditis belari TaxID=2138241 RepID=A0AAF3FSV7_9BILA
MQIRKSDTTASLFPNMVVSGPYWSLYPLLAVIAICSFLVGMVHLFLCLPFFFFLLPILAGTMGCVAAFHAVFLRYPNRCDFSLQLTCSLVSFAFFSTSIVETYCLSDLTKVEETSQSVCHGMKYRTAYVVTSCRLFLDGVQTYLLEYIGWNEERERLKFGVSIALTLLSAVQLFCCTALMVYSARETKLRLYSYHYQCVVGAVTFFVGFIHWHYCCTFFFLFLPIFSGLFGILQGAITWKHRCHGPISRTINLVGSALAVLLFATIIFGIFCWTTRLIASSPPLTYHCHWLPNREHHCYRWIHFSIPYIEWQPHETEREILVVQMISYGSLVILSALHFGFSLKSTFAMRSRYLYY